MILKSHFDIGVMRSPKRCKNNNDNDNNNDKGQR